MIILRGDVEGNGECFVYLYWVEDGFELVLTMWKEDLRDSSGDERGLCFWRGTGVLGNGPYKLGTMCIVYS